MLTYLIVIIANLLIGGMIGLTGIAGFLLPMLYSGFMGMPAVQALALSFFAFLTSTFPMRYRLDSREPGRMWSAFSGNVL